MPRIDEVWYDLELRSQNFIAGMQNAEASAARFTAYMKANPIAVAGAVAAGLVVVGVKATKMAAEVDTALRKVQAAFPAAAGEMKKIRQEVEDLSRVTPRSQAELAAALEKVVAGGVDNMTEAVNRLKTAVDVADASGADLETTIEGLDGITDTFRQTADEGRESLVQLFAMTQGKVALEDVFAMLGRGGSSLKAMKVDVLAAGAALVTLADNGLTAKESATAVASVLDALTGASGDLEVNLRALGVTEEMVANAGEDLPGFFAMLAEKLGGSTESAIKLGFGLKEAKTIMVLGKQANEDFAKAAGGSADAMDRLREAAKTNRESADALWKLLKNDFSAVMIDLGNVLLPAVIGGMKALRELLSGEFDNRFLEATREELGFIWDLLRSIGSINPQAMWRSLRAERARERERRENITEGVVSGSSSTAPDAPAPPAEDAEDDGTGTPGETPADRLARLQAEGEKAKALAEQRQALMDQLQQTLADMTDTTLDNLALELERLEKQIAETFGPGTPDEFRIAAQRAIAALRSEIESMKVLEPINRELTAMEAQVDGVAGALRLGFTGPADEFSAKLSGIITQLQAEVKLTAEGSKERKAAEEALKRALDLQKKLADAGDDTKEAAEKEADARARAAEEAEKAAAATRKMASEMRSVVSGAVDLAHSLGIVNDQAAQALDSMAQIGAGIMTGDIGSILNGAAGLISAFGESPEERARREALERLTRAITDLRDEIGNVDAAIAGRTFGAAERALSGSRFDRFTTDSTFANMGWALGDEGRDRLIDDYLRPFGLEVDDLRQIADALGIDFVNTATGLRAFGEALAAVELTRFQTTLEGQLQHLGYAAEIMGMSLEEEAAEFFRIITEREELKPGRKDGATSRARFGVLGDTLAGADLTTEAGVLAAQQRVRDSMAGFSSLSPEDLGELTPRQYLDTLAEASRYLDELLRGFAEGEMPGSETPGEGEGEDYATTGFQVDRRITEVTGMRIHGELVGIRTELEVIEEVIRAGLHVPVTLVPPATTTTGSDAVAPSGRGAVAITFGPGSVVVEITMADANVAEATAAGRAAGDAFLDQLDQQLGARQELRALDAGNVIVTRQY